jgi:hypothetical protein
MDRTAVNLQIPASLYADLEALALEKQTEPIAVIARLVEVAREQHNNALEPDPVFDLVGPYSSQRPLIDDIPVSGDPDLYVVVESLGERATGMHAWELTPVRYAKGRDGLPMRRW